jgi:DNA topoisomerase VI subunit A
LFAVLALVMELRASNWFALEYNLNITSLLITADRTISLRDVYYTLKNLFRLQRESNATILELGRILNIRRCKLLYLTKI